ADRRVEDRRDGGLRTKLAWRLARGKLRGHGAIEMNWKCEPTMRAKARIVAPLGRSPSGPPALTAMHQRTFFMLLKSTAPWRTLDIDAPRAVFDDALMTVFN